MPKTKITYLTAVLIASLAATTLVVAHPWDSQERQLLEERREKHRRLADDLSALRGRDGLVRADSTGSESTSTHSEQLGTIRGNYTAARSLAAAGALGETPTWLIDSTEKAAQNEKIPDSEKLAVAVVCERLAIDCSGLRERGRQIAQGIPVPSKVTAEDMRQWTDAMEARFEFDLGCPRTEVQLPNKPVSDLPHQWLHALELLGQLDCDRQLRQLTDSGALISRTRQAIESGK